MQVQAAAATTTTPIALYLVSKNNENKRSDSMETLYHLNAESTYFISENVLAIHCLQNLYAGH